MIVWAEFSPISFRDPGESKLEDDFPVVIVARRIEPLPEDSLRLDLLFYLGWPPLFFPKRKGPPL